MAGLSQRLFTLGRPNLERQLAHPTVRGIANGDLDRTRFRSWLVQDYLFLLDYVRLFALAAARAPDTDTLGRLVDLAHATFHQELSLHRAYAAEFGLAEADLDRAQKSPLCSAYTDFLLRTAATAEFVEVLAALLPCMWGYSELGRSMAATGLPTEPRYRRWIQTYADPGFAALAAWFAALQPPDPMAPRRRTAQTVTLRRVEPGRPPHPTELDLVFRTERGTPVNPNHASRTFTRLAASVGLVAHPHLLRHALASAMAANKEPASIIAAQLRHADGGGLAQRVYIHQLPQTAPRLAGLIEGVFGPAARGTQVIPTVTTGRPVEGNRSVEPRMIRRPAVEFPQLRAVVAGTGFEPV